MIDLKYFEFACANFLIFLVYLILIRIGHHPNPLQSMNRFHRRFLIIYLAFSIAYASDQNHFDFASWFVGFFVYFALQYGVFMHVFGVAMRSFSLNICISIFKKESFANAKGTDFIKRDRLIVMEGAKTIYQDQNLFFLTPRGRFVVGLNRLILNLWGLALLGKAEKKGQLT